MTALHSELDRDLAFSMIRERLFGTPAPPMKVDRFVITRRIGRGGMGLVYSAYDPRLDRPVAIKFVLDLGRTEHEIERARRGLEREAKAAARLAHPNVVTVFDSGDFGDGFYIVMELVSGPTLRQWLVQTDHPWANIAQMFVGAGRGLTAAHSAGLIHCDFKPDNVLVGEDGRPRVADFGLVRWAVESAPASVTGASATNSEYGETVFSCRAGTPDYMAPEQRGGPSVGPKADQFSFCVALYSALFGALPYKIDEDSGALLLVEAHRVGSSSVPESLTRVLLVGLALEPDERHGSMAVLVERIEKILGRHHRRPGYLQGAALLMLGGSMVGGAALLSAEDAKHEPCAGGTAVFESVWNDESRARVKTSILTTELSYSEDTWKKVSSRLDAYADSWIEHYEDNCEATNVHGQQSENLMDLRMTCLDERRDYFADVVDIFSESDRRIVYGAVDAVASLPLLSDCADLQAVQAVVSPPPRPVADRVEELRRQLIRSRALLRAGKVRDSEELVDEVLVAATETSYGPLVGEALLQRADARRRSSGGTEAVSDFKRAYLLAIEHQHSRVEVEAAIWITETLLVEGKLEEATRWLDISEALSSRRSTLSYWKIAVAGLQADVARIEGRYKDALDRHLEVARWFRVSQGESHPDVAAEMNSVAMALEALGRSEEAVVYYRDAVSIIDEAYGKGHPQSAVVLGNFGNTLRASGDFEGSLAMCRRAEKIYKETLGEQVPPLAGALACTGSALLKLGRLDEAMADYERSVSILEATLGPKHGHVGRMLANISNALVEAGEFESALEHLRRAELILVESVGSGHPDVAAIYVAVGKIYRGQGQLRAARNSVALGARALIAAYDDSHPKVLDALHVLGLVLSSEGLLDVPEHVEGASHVERDTVLQWLAANAPAP